MVDAGVEGGHLDPVAVGLLIEICQVRIGDLRAPVWTMLVLKLNHEHAAPVVKLMLGHDLLHRVKMGVRERHGPTHFTRDHPRFDHQPRRIAAHFPFRA